MSNFLVLGGCNYNYINLCYMNTLPKRMAAEDNDDTGKLWALIKSF